ncbi:unnamed protein product [Eruca vesicaria subsp. sativa]|uniref:Uncharacterized protein n=1 Tax=Eruca vesicaria subsp. sativa TaxID=29727 RepID=A0ABC8LQ72_ERUVS|nr:unnamed protein product [Eruca vesicaria subsp. sativa]
MVTFSANRTTNEFGLYKVAITSLDCTDVDNLASSCQASLVGRRRSSSDLSCNVPGYRNTTDQVVLKSKRSNLCIYGFNALNFRPFKRLLPCVARNRVSKQQNYLSLLLSMLLLLRDMLGYEKFRDTCLEVCSLF